MKSLLSLLLFVCMGVAQAQEESPKWLTADMTGGEAIGRGVDAQAAQMDAIGQLFERFTLQVDSTSLLARLQQEDSTFVLDQRKEWVRAAVGHASFVTLDTLQTDSLYWVHMQVTPEGLSQYTNQLQQSRMMRASECLIHAHFNREQGNLFGAAQDYARGLSAIVPCMHHSLTSDILEGKDLGQMLLEEYLQVFEGVQVEALRDSLPVVAGEDIPVNLQFRITANGKPLSNMPVQGWIEEGRMNADATTNEKGIVSLHVAQAPHKKGTYAGIIVHANLIEMLEDNFARPKLAAKLDGGFQTARTCLVPFDPTPRFFVQIDSLDIAHHDSLSVAMSRRGLVETDQLYEADMVCSLEYSGERGAGEKHGDYMLASTQCNLRVAVRNCHDGAEVASFVIPQFKLMHPAAKSEDDVRTRAVTLMMRQVCVELGKVFQPVSFDKRAYVYSQVK